MGLGTRACLALPQHPAELGGKGERGEGREGRRERGGKGERGEGRERGREREGRRGGEGDRRRKGEGRRGQGRRGEARRGKTKKQGKGESLIPNFIVTV